MTPHTILIVEDDQSLSNILAKDLQKAGFTVFQSSNGEEGLQLIESKKPNLILLDLTMPKVDGITMLRELRKREENRVQTPVLILTNLGDLEKMAEATELGALGYLQKSEWHLDEVEKKIREILGISAQ
jgi:DNA-binding response OmpR family regulator